jgi:6-phosphogluconolactonase
MSEIRLHVSEDPAAEIGVLLAEAARRGGAIVLTGGSAASPSFREAAALEPDWSNVSVWWSDERCVPLGHTDTNFRLAEEDLLPALTGRPEVHRIRGELGPEAGAADYEEQLGDLELDFALLGLGPDGHIASLFAGSPQLAERTRRVAGGPAGLEPFVDRVTMTLPTLLGIGRIAFLIEGADKAEAVVGAFVDPPSESIPGSLLQTADVPVDVFLDFPAARYLA